MRMIAMGAGVLGAMLVAASPAMAQKSDPDVVCFLLTASQAHALSKAGKDGTQFDSAGYYYLALIAQRYPDADTLAPIVSASAAEVAAGDADKRTEECVANLLPKLQLVQAALAAARK